MSTAGCRCTFAKTPLRDGSEDLSANQRRWISELEDADRWSSPMVNGLLSELFGDMGGAGGSCPSWLRNLPVFLLGIDLDNRPAGDAGAETDAKPGSGDPCETRKR